VYGKVLPNQNGAPLRLIVPWKYGFKSIKSIGRIHFTERRPETTWNMATPHEYGFYSNVNPNVDHPRWSQATGRVLGGSGIRALISSRQPTLMFNGYAEEVASLYTGLDLVKNYVSPERRRAPMPQSSAAAVPDFADVARGSTAACRIPASSTVVP